MALSIIIVNYRSSEDICNCLESAQRVNIINSFKWLIVDNNSEDNSQATILSRFPFVQWIDMGYNAGFARANNKGIQAAGSDDVLLLNPDTLFLDNNLENCYKQFQRSQYVACGIQLLNSDHTSQISGNYIMKGALNNLLPLPYIGNCLKWGGDTLKVKKPHLATASTEAVVDWINGAFLMAKRTAIEKAGLLDEDFFLYAEEAEWCRRLRQFGKLCIYGQYKIVHLQGETANKAFGSSDKGYYNLYDRKGRQIMLSNFLRIRKEFGKGWFLFHLAAYTMTIPVFFIGILIEHLVRLRNPLNRLSQVIGFTNNVGHLWRFTSRILRNRPYFYKVL